MDLAVLIGAQASDDDEEVVVTTLPMSSTSAHIGVRTRGDLMPRLARADSTTNPIQKMPAEANIDRLREWSEEAEKAFAFMENATFEDPAPDAQRGVSRGFSIEDIAIIESITEPVKGKALTLAARKIAKSDGISARLIINGRPANARMHATLKPKMPDLSRILAPRNHKYGWTADLRQWFYQLSLPKNLRRLFAMKLASRRGKFKLRWMTRLPMGASFAPAVAQAAAESLLLETTRRLNNENINIHVWIDNVWCTAETTADAKRALKTFKEVCEEASVEIKESSEVTTEIELLGVRVELETRKVGPQDRLQEKLRDAGKGKITSCREFMINAGIVFFPNYIYGRRPLADYPCLFADIQRACIAAKKSSWDEKFTPSPKALDELQALASALCDATTKSDYDSPQTLVWSDASTEAIAWIRQSNGTDEAMASFNIITSHEDIYHTELLAAVWGSINATDRHALIVDNTAAAAALRKGHSSTRRGNRLLKQWLQSATCVGVGWVPTDRQRADALTRGCEKPTIPPWEPESAPTIWKKTGRGERSKDTSCQQNSPV